ncbi:MAG: T9SS type A sorting domain-containing protein [Rhodothermales bacterium]
MHTIYTVLKQHYRVFVLSFVVMSFCTGQVWAQSNASGGYDRVTEQSNQSALLLNTASLFNQAHENTEQQQADFVSIYPMPFNPQTTIRFDLRAAQQVRLTVYNVLGQAVQVLVNGHMETGRHEARFVAGDLPSGLYFARLETKTGVVTRTMVLAK